MSAIEIEKPANTSHTRTSRATQYRLYTLALLVGDAVALAAAFVIAYDIRFFLDLPIFDESGVARGEQLLGALLLIPLCLVIFALFRLYDRQYLLGGTQEYARVFQAV